DEPTVGLSLSETKKTLDFVQNIKKSGRSAIFIDHNIFHIYPAVDRMIVLDRGKVAGMYKKSEITMDELIDSMYRVARTGNLKEQNQ
ncbi:MAG: sugar ABC transporter ATP-binding protein, partial [Actinomycetes bacterium]